MAFEDIPEQQDTARRLRAMLQRGRLPHAFLFVGSAGTGRTAVARELARVILCSRRDTPDDYCGRCDDCLACEAGRHPDYYEVGVPQGKQSLPIETIRQVQHRAGLKPVRAPRRVFVVGDAERMTIEAANCFLKTLEEPPGRCFFVLVASSLRQIPETIVSRCQVIRFGNLPPDVLQQRLEADGMEPEDARWLARRAWGSPGLAARFHETGLHLFNRELVEKLHGLSAADNFALSDWLSKEAAVSAASGAESRIALQELLECIAVYYRDLALAAAGGGAPQDLVNGAAAETIAEAAAGAEPDAFLEPAELVLETIERVGSNAYRRLALDHMFTRLAFLGKRAT